MKSKIIKKLIMSSLCLSLCFGLFQTSVMAAEIKSDQKSANTKSVAVNDKTNTKQDVEISEADKKAALSNKLSSADIVKKYGSKGSTEPSKLLTRSTTSSQLRLNAVSDVDGSNELSDSFYFLDDSDLYGGDQRLFSSSYRRETGCGPITACNILAYHAKYYGRSELYPYEWTKADWIKYQNDMFGSGGGIQTLTKFNVMITDYPAFHGYSYGSEYDSYYLNTDSNLTDMCNFIKDQIDNDNPVAMLIGTKTSGATYRTNFSVHWVTITGYDFNGESSDPYVKVSSWGEEYDLDLAKLLAQRDWIDLEYVYER